MQKESKLYLGDCLNVLPTLDADSIDTIVTDPPYGLKFMNNKWDASVPSVDIWKECLRVLKPGAFTFVMSSPRQDVLSRMIINLTDAGFDTHFSSIYWTYNNGFPKAQNISKVLDKRAGAEQTIIGHYQAPDGANRKYDTHSNKLSKVYKMDNKTYNDEERPIKGPTTENAKKFEGSYAGFQPKPAVEIVIVAMKPLSEKTYVDQVLKNGHGCTWLDKCRIPYESDAEIGVIESKMAKKVKMETPRNQFLNGGLKKTLWKFDKRNGRFPANVLCEDDVLNDGNIRTTGGEIKNGVINSSVFNPVGNLRTTTGHVPGDSGSLSRYFSLDAWFLKRIKLLPKEAQKTFPWLHVSKPSKNEKNKNLPTDPELSQRLRGVAYNEYSSIHSEREKGNPHTTIKPLKLMMWLIILGTQEGDIVLDPFMGSGTTPLAAKMTHRPYKGIELKKEFFDTAVLRVDEVQKSIDKFL